MSIVEWQEVVEISTGTERDQELMIGILKLDTEKTGEKWQGLIKRNRNKLPTQVELRKHIGGANILIVLDRIKFNKGKDIQLSMNAKARFTTEQMNEMNLAILEGRNVLSNEIQKAILTRRGLESGSSPGS